MRFINKRFGIAIYFDVYCSNKVGRKKNMKYGYVT